MSTVVGTVVGPIEALNEGAHERRSRGLSACPCMGHSFTSGTHFPRLAFVAVKREVLIACESARRTSMEALDGLVQGVHTNDGAFVVLAQLLRGEPRKLRVSITDGFHAWYERDYAEAEWAAMCTAAGDVSEEAFAHRVQRGFTDGMLDPVQAADQRTFYVRVDALSTVSKVIEFRLDRVRPIAPRSRQHAHSVRPDQIAESEKPTRIQQLLQSVRDAPAAH